MNIFKRELRANLKSLLIWCGAQFFIIYAGMVKYGSFKSSGVDINEMFESFPKSIGTVFGIGGSDLSKVEGFYAVFFLYFMLLAAIHASMLGVVILSKEERDHSADFLFAKPVPRSRVITAKLCAALVNIAVFNMLTYAASVLFIGQYNDGNGLADKVGILMLALFILQVLFLSIGSALGSIMKTTRKASSINTAIILGAFFLSVAVDLYDKIDFLKYATPFKYFDANSLLNGGAYSIVSIVLCVILTGLCLVCTYVKFGSRDLTT
jgi:ABC-2 type transport system permease protein